MRYRELLKYRNVHFSVRFCSHQMLKIRFQISPLLCKQNAFQREICPASAEPLTVVDCPEVGFNKTCGGKLTQVQESSTCSIPFLVERSAFGILLQIQLALFKEFGKLFRVHLPPMADLNILH